MLTRSVETAVEQYPGLAAEQRAADAKNRSMTMQEFMATAPERDAVAVVARREAERRQVAEFNGAYEGRSFQFGSSWSGRAAAAQQEAVEAERRQLEAVTRSTYGYGFGTFGYNPFMQSPAS